MLQRLNSVVAVLMLVACSGGDSSRITAQATQASQSVSASGGHEMKTDDGLSWGPAPAIFPAGAQFAVVQGDPHAAGQIFTVRLRFPNGYIIPPHTHPTDEHVTVLKGTFLVGLGENFTQDGMIALKDGGFITAPANHAHFAMARGMTEVQVHAIGPFQLTYVHPSDDPTK